MGRKAGWLSYGVAIAGEANLVLGVEDVDETLLDEHETLDLGRARRPDRRRDDRCASGATASTTAPSCSPRGSPSSCPTSSSARLPRDEHGHISLGRIDLGKLVAHVVAERYEARTGAAKKVTGLQLGYETRCAPPHAFDVMLGSQLGIGAYRALVEEGLDGHMVSVSGQLDLHYVPFKELVDPDTLRTEVRFIQRGSDFHRLARFLETRTDRISEWALGRRTES